MSEEKPPEKKEPLIILRQNEDAWLKTVYIETWKQYVHEDQLVQSRSSVFLVV